MPSALSFLEGTSVQPWRWRAFCVSFAAFGLLLFACTWRLWTPQTVFPQVPLFAVAGSLPPQVEWFSLAAIVASLILSLVPRFASASYVAFAIATTLLCLADQHRLQPWAFQFTVVALVLALLPPSRAFALLRVLVVSMYLWSAIAKCDATFLSTLGQQFLAALVGLVGLSTDDWSPASRRVGAWIFPLGELVIGFCLLLSLHSGPRTRRVVIGAAVAMHLVLILLLSPLGLGHQPAVLVWNGWFIAQAVLLFGFPGKPAIGSPEDVEQLPSWASELYGVFGEVLIGLVVLLPLLRMAGRYDHWLAWGLYAPSNSRVSLYIDSARAASLAPHLQQYLAPTDNARWQRLRLDAWSLKALDVPIYPQDRFQLGVARAVIDSEHLDGDFEIVVESAADPWSGKREYSPILDARHLQAVQQTFLLNSQPRE
jgi:hypothetical protein